METDLDASKYWTGGGEGFNPHGWEGQPKASWWVHWLHRELLLESVAVKGKMYSPAKHWIFFGRLFAGIVVIHHVNSDCWCLINPQSAPTTVGRGQLEGVGSLWFLYLSSVQEMGVYFCVSRIFSLKIHSSVYLERFNHHFWHKLSRLSHGWSGLCVAMKSDVALHGSCPTKLDGLQPHTLILMWFHRAT